MGSWGEGPFENDGAAELLDACADGAAARAVSAALRGAARAPTSAYLDADVGGPAWAACELVAMAFGRPPKRTNDGALEVASRLRPSEPQRALAVAALLRIRDPKRSELAGLWSEGNDGRAFQARMRELARRLAAASAGPVALKAPKPGDVIALPGRSPEGHVVTVQILGASEIAVFAGTTTKRAALAGVATRPASRVVASASAVSRAGTLLGGAAVRRDLRGKKLYAMETGDLSEYWLTPPRGVGRTVLYEGARAYDPLVSLSVAAIVALATGAAPARVRTPAERRAEHLASHAGAWAQVRARTGPGPFGDPEAVERIIEWIELTGLAHVTARLADELSDATRSGKQLHNQVGPYAFAGLVAVWRGRGDARALPPALASRIPKAPKGKVMAEALRVARGLAANVLARDTELRDVWQSAPDGGAALRAAVASLEAALAP